MTELSKTELRARLDGIQVGPWSKGFKKARKALAPVDLDFVFDPAPLALQKVVLSNVNQRKSAQLEKVLRPHYKGSAITDKKEIETREALDDALTIPQLYELAIQTGYLPVDSVKERSRSILTDLLWSAPARLFVEAYDYVAIPMLAERVGISGFPSTNPPEPSPKSALRFAGFLAHLRAFYNDDQIDTWLGFLDDYVVEHNEQGLVWRYLHRKRRDPPKRLPELLTGCQHFVRSLATAFHVLNNDELGRYGLMHSYWLQKFFGYERNERGQFVKDIEVWGKKDSWAQTFLEAPSMVWPDIESEIQNLVRQQFFQQVKLLQRVFNAVRQLATETRQPVRSPERPMGVRKSQGKKARPERKNALLRTIEEEVEDATW